LALQQRVSVGRAVKSELVRDGTRAVALGQEVLHGML
jgi:hypothetical protein